MFSLNSTVVSAISRELDFCALRHQIYSANVANVDTPNYQRLEVVQSLQSIPVPDAGNATGQVVSTNDVVKLDQELAKLTKNALRYETLLTAYEKTTGILNLAIKEGRGS